jgi:2,5-furandicarboxylate decarboxylase 1
MQQRVTPLRASQNEWTARQSPVLEVRTVLSAKKPIYPTIITGAESSLTLMALQNEYLMHTHLTDEAFPVRSVRYPLEDLGEFVTLIETDQPSTELVRSAMAFDARTKVVICGPKLDKYWSAIATYGFQIHYEPYFRRGKMEGQCVGFILDQPSSGYAVEY